MKKINILLFLFFYCLSINALTFNGVGFNGINVDNDNSAGIINEDNPTVCIYGSTLAANACWWRLWYTDETYQSIIVLPNLTYKYGMTGGGLSVFDIGNGGDVSHGGIWADFIATLGAHSAEPSVIKSTLDTIEDAYMYRLSELPPFITQIVNARVYKVDTEIRNGKKHIKSAYFKSSDGNIFKITADWFVDASYEQDLMALAGIPYTYGRESRTKYKEWLAGKTYQNNGRGLDHYLSDNEGGADTKCQAYTYRLIVKTNGSGRDFPKPKALNQSQFTELQDWIDTYNPSHLSQILYLSLIPNSKYDMNGLTTIWQSSDFVSDKLYLYSNCGKTLRNEIENDVKEYIKNLIYYLQNNTNVPANIRTEANNLQLTTDEFTDLDGWSPQLYVRESRRIKGDYICTQYDVLDPRYKYKQDSICLATYPIDCHHCDKWIHKGWRNFCDGHLFLKSPFRTWCIPYRSLYTNDCDNFLTAFGVSMSHVAFNSARMEAQFCHFGYACANAIIIAEDDGLTDIADVDITQLQTSLLSNDGRLVPAVLYPVDPFSVSDYEPDINETVTLTLGYKDATACKWDFDGNGTVDSTDTTVQIQFPKEKQYWISCRPNNSYWNASYTWIVYCGGYDNSEEKQLYNDVNYGKPDDDSWSWSTVIQGFLGYGYYIDDNDGKSIKYFEIPITVETSDYYDISLQCLKDATLENNFPDNVPVEIELDNGTVYNYEWNQQDVSYTTRPFNLVCIKQNCYLQSGVTHYVRIQTDNTKYKVYADALFLTESGTWTKDTDNIYKWTDY